MIEILVPEVFDVRQHHVGGFIADGAVRSILNGLCQPQHVNVKIHVSGAVKNLLHHFFQLFESLGTGNAFTAGLTACGTQICYVSGYAADSRRIRQNPFLKG